MKLLCFTIYLFIMCILFRSIFSSRVKCIVSNDGNSTFRMEKNHQLSFTLTENTENEDEISRYCHFRLFNSSIQNLVLPSSFKESYIYISYSNIYATASFKISDESFISITDSIFIDADMEFIIRKNSQLYFERCDIISNSISVMLEDHSVFILKSNFRKSTGKIHVHCSGDHNIIIDENPYEENISFSENCHYKKHFKGLKGLDYEDSVYLDY